MAAMVALLILVLAQHAVVSAKAGLVTYAEGVVNVAVNDLVGEGNVLISGPSGRAEMTLNPDSYLRILPYSRVRIRSEEVAAIDLVLEAGTAIADIRALDGDFPIALEVSGIPIEIRRNGVYLFEMDRIAVLDGELRFGDDGARLGEGDALRLADNADTPAIVRIDDDLEHHPLVRWNQFRREAITVAQPMRRLRPGRF